LDIQAFNPETDREAGRRIWEEVGWLDRNEKNEVIGHDAYVDAGRGLVTRIDGEVECMVLAAGGSLRYLGEDVTFSGVTGVTTSRVARRQGFAARMTARLIAEETDAGAATSGLGMFEQGFYNRLGYGTGVYETWMAFDPQLLKVPFPTRPPKRLAQEDWEKVHACRLRRRLHHGSVSFDSPLMTKGHRMESPKTFGLGFYDEADGNLSHHVWITPGEGENGPYEVAWMTYQSPEQYMELLGVLRTLGDQVRMIRMFEAPGIQLQDFLDQPLQNRMITFQTKFETGAKVLAFWQIRICKLEECLARTKLRSGEARFNLQLSDPITKHLDATTEWQGAGGDYVVTLGKESGAEPGADASLPTMKASVNAFSRLWLGVRPATGLAITDELGAPQELLEELDWVLRLPVPIRDWDF